MGTKRAAYNQLPDQPMRVDPDGVLRFTPNRIVAYMLNLLQNQQPRAFDLNMLACMLDRGMFTAEEYAQFTQLHGYSLSGFCELSGVPDKIKNRCATSASEQGLDE